MQLLTTFLTNPDQCVDSSSMLGSVFPKHTMLLEHAHSTYRKGAPCDATTKTVTKSDRIFLSWKYLTLLRLRNSKTLPLQFHCCFCCALHYRAVISTRWIPRDFALHILCTLPAIILKPEICMWRTNRGGEFVKKRRNKNKNVPLLDWNHRGLDSRVHLLLLFWRTLAT